MLLGLVLALPAGAAPRPMPALASTGQPAGYGALPGAAPGAEAEVVIEAATTAITSTEQMIEVSGQVISHSEQDLRGDISFRVANDAFVDRQSLEDWRGLDLAGLDEASWEAVAESRQLLTAGGQLEFSLAVKANALNLGNLDDEPGWGPRGFAISFSTNQGLVAAAPGYLTFAPPEEVAARARLTVTAGLVIAPNEAWPETVTRLTGLMRATNSPDITWLLDPAVLDQEATQSPNGARPLATSVSQALEDGKTIYALPYGDPSLARLAQIQDQAFPLVDQALVFGEARLIELLGEPTAALIRTGVDWVEGSVDANTLALASRTGARALVLAAEGHSPANDQIGQMVEMASGGARVPALVADASLTSAVVSPQEASLITGYASATLALEAAQQQLTDRPGRSAITLPRDAEASAGLAQRLAGLMNSPWVAASSLDQTIETKPASRLDVAGSAGPDSGPSDGQLRQVALTVQRAEAFSTITGDPVAFYQEVLPDLLMALSGACHSRPACDAAAVKATGAANTRMDQVSVVTGGDINLISNNGKVPVIIANRSIDDVAGLRVSLEPKTTAVRAGQAQSVDIKAGESATVRIEVQAVANGMVPVMVDLSNQAGDSVMVPAEFNMRVRAGWEDVFTAIGGALVLGVLIVGLIQAVRQRGRRRQGDLERVKATT